jgi:ClpP class serine protease
MYPRILSKVFREPWLITPGKHETIQRLLIDRVSKGRRVLDDDDNSWGVEVKDDGRREVQDYGETRIIPVHGIIGQHLSALEMECGGCDIGAIAEQIRLAQHDSNVARVLFDFRSPGGTVTGIPECARMIAALGKPTIAFCDSECCSGAIYLASQCDEFYATASSNIGSVGVYQYFEDWTQFLANEGIKPNPISSGEFKLSGAWFKPMTDAERAMFQAGCDKIYTAFKAAVVSKRPVNDEFLQGQIFDGDEAAAHGFLSGVVDDMDQCLQLAGALTPNPVQHA